MIGNTIDQPSIDVKKESKRIADKMIETVKDSLKTEAYKHQTVIEGPGS